MLSFSIVGFVFVSGTCVICLTVQHSSKLSIHPYKSALFQWCLFNFPAYLP